MAFVIGSPTVADAERLDAHIERAFSVDVVAAELADPDWLGVWEQNHNAIALYQHRGFAVFDQHVFMFGTEAQTDLLMRLDLR